MTVRSGQVGEEAGGRALAGPGVRRGGQAMSVGPLLSRWPRKSCWTQHC